MGLTCTEVLNNVHYNVIFLHGLFFLVLVGKTLFNAHKLQGFGIKLHFLVMVGP